MKIEMVSNRFLYKCPVLSSKNKSRSIGKQVKQAATCVVTINNYFACIFFTLYSLGWDKEKIEIANVEIGSERDREALA